MNTELLVDFDPTVWVLIDPADTDPDEWAVEVAKECFADAGAEADTAELGRLATLLLGAYEGTSHLAGFVLMHLPDPYGDPGPIAHVTAFDATDGSVEALRELAGADDPDLVEPAVVEWFESDLGAALRCRRHPSDGAGDATMVVSYVWHLPAHDSDVRLSGVAGEIDQLTAVLDDLDDLARSVQLVEPTVDPPT